MKLPKAIEILNSHYQDQHPRFDPDTEDAIMLGIEALKRVNAHRESSLTDPHIVLPGETKE